MDTMATAIDFATRVFITRNGAKIQASHALARRIYGLFSTAEIAHRFEKDGLLIIDTPAEDIKRRVDDVILNPADYRGADYGNDSLDWD